MQYIILLHTWENTAIMLKSFIPDISMLSLHHILRHFNDYFTLLQLKIKYTLKKRLKQIDWNLLEDQSCLLGQVSIKKSIEISGLNKGF